MRLVIDASVVVKWVFPESPEEENTEEALALAPPPVPGAMGVRVTRA
jgi:predicted nucleic acid-binding protein